MAIIGYLEGTNPDVLSSLIVEGHDTLPIGNGWDDHGKYIGHLTKNDNISLIVGYLHKVVPPKTESVKASDVLSACEINDIPVLVVASEDEHKKAKSALGDVADYVKLVDPSKMEETILKSI